MIETIIDKNDIYKTTNRTKLFTSKDDLMRPFVGLLII